MSLTLLMLDLIKCGVFVGCSMGVDWGPLPEAVLHEAVWPDTGGGGGQVLGVQGGP
jgi:hypothetical protein